MRTLRGRLAVLSAIGSAVLLITSAALLYAVLSRQQQATTDQSLFDRIADIATTAGPVIPNEELFAQILTPDGALLSSSPGAASRAPVLTPAESRVAAEHEMRLNRDVPGLGGDARLLAHPIDATTGRVVVVVGTSRTAVLAGQRRLAAGLVVVAILLLGALAGGGWLLAGAALRPVGRMSDEAAAISLAAGRRLPQPAGDDEIAHLGRTLNAMLDRIDASFARERAFVDDASHELRTPLAILRGELELALSQTHDPEEMGRALRSALEEAERLSRLADDLLVLARSQAGDIPLSRKEIDVLGEVDRVVGRLGASNVRVEGEPVTASVDPARLDQIVLNLVVNAQRFARSQVRVGVAGVDGSVEVVVADDGPGFAPHLLPRVFDRFSRGDNARARDEGGVGLGLSIVDALVRAHHGTVEASNGPPLGGGVVRVQLPR